MTDTSNTKPKLGFSKAGAAVILLEIAQHVNPVLAQSLASSYPIIGDQLSSEIVSFGEAALGGFVVWLTPGSFVQGVKDAILWARLTLRTWRDAMFKKLPDEPTN